VSTRTLLNTSADSGYASGTCFLILSEILMFSPEVAAQLRTSGEARSNWNTLDPASLSACMKAGVLTKETNGAVN
jgi:hypothetical protein